MIYGSVCSGIEAATAAWAPLGWQAQFLSEIEAFPRAVLKHRHPGIPLHGDFTTIQANDYGSIDLLVGGTPCQSFSIAGLRKGMADDRGNLALEYLRLADRLRPKWLVWENVPGVLSSNGGRDFGSFLGGLGELGYGFAYRVLDAQFFGLAQRRKRVFVVGHLGDWRRAAAVLFEPASLRGDPTPRREAGAGIAACLTFGAHPGGHNGQDDTKEGRLIAFDTTQITSALNRSNPQAGDPCHPLAAGAHPPAVAFQQSQSGMRVQDTHATLDANNGSRRHNGVMAGSAVRRLTPRECERLMGFSDDYTLIPWRGGMAPDGPRYKALGNSMAVPVMRHIGERIAMVEAHAVSIGVAA